MLNRREALKSAVLAGTVPLLAQALKARHDETVPTAIIDTNVSLFHWPFRRLPLDKPEALAAKLKKLGIQRDRAGSVEALLHRDLAAVNQRLADASAAHPLLVPIGSVNVQLPDWRNDLDRCIHQHQMPGIRLHPNYHGYALASPEFHRLIAQATRAGLFIQLAAAMEDARTHSHLVQVPDVDLSPLIEIVPQVPGARIQILNAKLRGALLDQLAQTPGIYFDTARVDGTDGIPALMNHLPAGRLLFGSHAPFLIPQAALIRTHESGLLSAEQLRMLLESNAARFLDKATA